MVKRVVVVVMIGVVLLCLAATNYHRLKVIRFRPTSELERFEAQVGLDCKAVHEVVGRRLNRAYRGMEARRQRWEAYMLEDDGWAAEAVARRNSRSPEELEQFALDPELERYYELSPKERQFDWSLVHSGPQWDSEYEYRGKPAPFSASFIVHLRCDGPDATTVQIYEQEAYVCVGEWFGLQANFGHLFSSYSFGFHPDCRRVAPTRVDRADLLKQVQALF